MANRLLIREGTTDGLLLEDGVTDVLLHTPDGGGPPAMTAIEVNSTGVLSAGPYNATDDTGNVLAFTPSVAYSSLQDAHTNGSDDDNIIITEAFEDSTSGFIFNKDINVYVADDVRHDGTTGTGYRLVVSTGGVHMDFSNVGVYCGLSVEQTAANRAINMFSFNNPSYTADADMTFDSCLFYRSADGDITCLDVGRISGSIQLVLRNCFILSNFRCLSLRNNQQVADNITLENCNSYNDDNQACYFAGSGNDGKLLIRNCISATSASALNLQGGTAHASSTNNSVSDATGFGSNVSTSVAAASVFLDVSTLADADLHYLNEAIQVTLSGVDLSGSFIHDIDRQTRDVWYMGADYIPGAAPPSGDDSRLTTGLTTSLTAGLTAPIS